MTRCKSTAPSPVTFHEEKHHISLTKPSRLHTPLVEHGGTLTKRHCQAFLGLMLTPADLR